MYSEYICQPLPVRGCGPGGRRNLVRIPVTGEFSTGHSSIRDSMLSHCRFFLYFPRRALTLICRTRGRRTFADDSSRRSANRALPTEISLASIPASSQSPSRPRTVVPLQKSDILAIFVALRRRMKRTGIDHVEMNERAGHVLFFFFKSIFIVFLFVSANEFSRMPGAVGSPVRSFGYK